MVTLGQTKALFCALGAEQSLFNNNVYIIAFI
jgi:hypothetical protein